MKGRSVCSSLVWDAEKLYCGGTIVELIVCLYDCDALVGLHNILLPVLLWENARRESRRPVNNDAEAGKDDYNKKNEHKQNKDSLLHRSH